MYELIKKNLVYPKKAQKRGIQDTVFLMLLINADGTINRVSTTPHKFDKVYNKHLAKEALRVGNLLTKWNPGFYNGNPKSFALELPIAFTLK